MPRPRLSPALGIPLFVSLLATRAEAGPAPTAKPKAPPDPHMGPTPAETMARERRAVRGKPVEGDDAAESPELSDLREFEERAFPGAGGKGRGDTGTPHDDDHPARAVDDAIPGLPGRWGGSGDLPEALRTPEAPRGQPLRAAPPPPPPDSAYLASLQLPELPVRWDPLVLRYLEFWKSDPKGRIIMERWLRKLGRYQALFEKVLVREGLPKDLVYLAMVESGFETGAKSQASAVGVWQFMAGAGRAYGLEVSHWVDERRDPERAAEAAARYLHDLYERFGSWELVFASYNAGYGAVLRSIRAYNTNDYWELIRHESGLPWESSVYVPKILAAAVIGHNRKAFGFGDVVPDPPYAYELVEARPGTSLAAVAKAAGVSNDLILALNPELVRERTPPDRAPRLVRVPPGAVAAYREGSRKLDENVETIVLRFGEGLADVAAARGVSLRALKKMNGLDDTGDVRAGTAIVVPKLAKATGEAAEPAGEDDTVIVAVPDKVFDVARRDRVFYRTREGDTIEDVADAFRVSVAELCEWNNVDPNAKLQPKMTLQVFVAPEFDSAGIMLLDAAKVRVVTLGSQEFLELETARRGKKRLTYTCRDGDTLAKVGKRYGLTPGDLARINRFSHSTDLKEGQAIIVYAPVGDDGKANPVAPEPRRGGGKSAAKTVAVLGKKDGAVGHAAKSVAASEKKTSPAKTAAASGKTSAPKTTAKAPMPPAGKTAAVKAVATPKAGAPKAGTAPKAGAATRQAR